MNDVKRAREFCEKVSDLQKIYNLDCFFVTEGASITRNNHNNDAVRSARVNQIRWEQAHGFDPNEDWS